MDITANCYRTGGISAADARLGNSEADGYRNFGATGNKYYQPVAGYGALPRSDAAGL